MAMSDSELLQAHLARALEELPGPDYYSVLRWIHQVLCPARYLEIGIRHGDSLRLALPGTKCTGIDPAPVLDHPLDSVPGYLLLQAWSSSRLKTSRIFGERTAFRWPSSTDYTCSSRPCWTSPTLNAWHHALPNIRKYSLRIDERSPLGCD